MMLVQFHMEQSQAQEAPGTVVSRECSVDAALRLPSL